MAVINMSKPDMPAPVKLLLAQSYARIGADKLAADAAFEAIGILTGPGRSPAGLSLSPAEPTQGFSVLEMRALRSWLDRVDGIDLGFDEVRLKGLRDGVLGAAPETPEESVQLSSELDEMRQRVAAERTAEQSTTSRYQWINVGAGILAGGLAAASGVVGVAKGPTVVIALLAFASAAITAFLTALKPAEREKESKVRADALGQLTAAIELFDVDRPGDAHRLLPAVKAVHERLAIAEGRGRIVPLVASSNSTARPAITSVSPAEGPKAGGDTVTITGTGFTGASGVSFGTRPATSCDVVSDTQIIATTPAYTAGALKVKVKVTGPGGTSPADALYAYTYRAAPKGTQPVGDSN
jgi:hypothetical protein